MEMKFILWFDHIKQVMTGYQGFTKMLFLNTLMLFSMVILVYVFVKQGKSNLYGPIVVMLYL